MLHQRLVQLQHINLHLTQQCEYAGAIIPQLTSILDRLHSLGLIPETVILEAVVGESSYNASENRADSAQVFEAALLMPGGFGVVIWDVEEYVAREDSRFPLAADAKLRFVPFHRCTPALRGLMVPHVGPMLEQLCLDLPTNCGRATKRVL